MNIQFAPKIILSISNNVFLFFVVSDSLVLFYFAASIGLFANGAFVGWSSYANDILPEMVI